MNKWIVTKDGIKEEFLNFKDALNIFLNEIADHIWYNSSCNRDEENDWVYNDCSIPFAVGVFFNSKYDERTITDEEIVLESRLHMLLGHLMSKDANEIKDNAFKVLKHSLIYQGAEMDTKINIKVDLDPNEVVVDITADDGDESYLRTNAFVMDDDSKTYYFRSKQYVVTAHNPKNLGKEISLDIKLEKVE